MRTLGVSSLIFVAIFVGFPYFWPGNRIPMNESAPLAGLIIAASLVYAGYLMGEKR